MTGLKPQNFDEIEPQFEENNMKEEFPDRPLTYSQEQVLSALDPGITDPKNRVLVRMRQSLPGFMIGIFKSNENAWFTVDQLVEMCRPVH